MNAVPETGARAKDFELPDSTGQQRTLTGLLSDGKVLLIFFRGLW
jgi:peroxiredoxin